MNNEVSDVNITTLNAVPGFTDPQKKMFDKYQVALNNIPAPGGGCHGALLGVANYGVMAGLEQQQIAADIRKHIPAGARMIPDQEIWDAVDKAWNDLKDGMEYDRKPITPVCTLDADRLMQQLLQDGQNVTSETFLDISPVKIPLSSEADIQNHAGLVLDHLYDDGEWLYIGDQMGHTVRTVADWKTHLGQGPLGPHIIPNPLSGKQAKTKTGKDSYRADSCVTRFRFAVVEFDSMPLDDQYRFWGAIDLPVAALIFSGSKSIHGWIKVDCHDVSEWNQVVENTLFAQFLKPLGVDASCRNEARLSRLPGFYRQDKAQWQVLLYLSPEGVPPCIQ
jgi:hypothetical protein